MRAGKNPMDRSHQPPRRRKGRVQNQIRLGPGCFPRPQMAGAEPRAADRSDLRKLPDPPRRPSGPPAPDRQKAVDVVSGNFKFIHVADFEYEIAPGGLPVVLCLVVYVLDEFLRHIRTIRLWRDEFGSAPPFDIGPDTLFVAYSAWAEMACFLVLGWLAHPRPAHKLFGRQQYAAAL